MPDPLTIALVDDDASVRRALRRLLGSAGFEVRAFASADELLDSGFSSSAACLLVDVHLIGMSGLELVESLRSTGLRPAVVFMTAHDSERTREVARELGSAGYLRKPFDANALLEAIREAIESSHPKWNGRAPGGARAR